MAYTQNASKSLVARIVKRAKFVSQEDREDAFLLVRAGAGDRQIIANHPWLSEDWKEPVMSGPCTRCNGTGTYVWGTITNGVPQFAGVCFRCNGSGKEPTSTKPVNPFVAKPEPKTQPQAKKPIIVTCTDGEKMDLNGLSEHVASIAKSGDVEEVQDLFEVLLDAMTNPSAKGWPVAPNVFAYLLECVSASLRIRFGAQPRTIAPEVPVVPEITEPDAPKPEVPFGTYTLEFADGDHFTFRIVEKEFRGFNGGTSMKNVVQFLSGPDNSTDFEGFAFLNQQPGKLTINVWKRFERGDMVNRAREIETVLNGGDLNAAGLAYALRSSRCRRCNRVLTVPASIHMGYGPDCAEKIGL